ncbi:MAG: hypothetical protein KAJ51_05215, partial [Thermoplasmata archaeon]|nr:hypothetical protein [Thermoplasmata archaeon]
MRKTISIYIVVFLFLLPIIIPTFEYKVGPDHFEEEKSFKIYPEDFEETVFAPGDNSSAIRSITIPIVTTNDPIEITNASAKLTGELVESGGEDCTVWFQWDEHELEECAGLIATGQVCKDGRSIILKNRHAAEDNQQPRFYEGTNYTYFGVG